MYDTHTHTHAYVYTYIYIYMCVCACVYTLRREHRRPFMLLLPAWTAKWVPWRTFLWAMARVRKVNISSFLGGGCP